ncbi:MAG: hypothetical protein K0U41_08500 [Gammaproteobacteria bacterium]|nr:hypothetical protein [Gammaproteobacteria bacterium]
MTLPEGVITASCNILAPSLDIHRKMEFREKSTNQDPEIDVTNYIDKRFCYSTAYRLLMQGHRVARPLEDKGYIVLSMDRNPKRISSFDTDGNSTRQSYKWDEETVHLMAHDWTLADYPFDKSKEIPCYDNQPEVLQDFLFEHIEDPGEMALAEQFFQLACSIAYNNDEGHGKRVALDHLFNAKTVILHDMQKRRLRAIAEKK